MTPRILIVEDEALLSEMLRTMLEDNGLQVVGVAETAAQAIRLADETGPDFVLMDIRLRGMGDGIDAAIAIRKQQGTPVLFLSAYYDRRHEDRMRAAEPIGCLTKPVQAEQLLKAIGEGLAKSRAQQPAGRPN